MGNSGQQILVGSKLVDTRQTRRLYFCQGVHFARYNYQLQNVLVQHRLRQIQKRFCVLHRNIIRVLGFTSFPSSFCGDTTTIQIYTQHFLDSLDLKPHLLSDSQVGSSLSAQIESVKQQYAQRKIEFARAPRLEDFQLAPGFQAKYLDCVLTGEISLYQDQNDTEKTKFNQLGRASLASTRKSFFSQNTGLSR